MGTGNYSSAQDSGDRQPGTRNETHPDSQQNNGDRQHQTQSMADDEETEYRGMEHAALGVMLSERQGQGVAFAMSCRTARRIMPGCVPETGSQKSTASR